MDDATISREDLDKLLNFVTKEKYINWMNKVKRFSEQKPEHPLNEAEAFLLLLSTTKGLVDSLKLWQIREDCEAMEREICKPLDTIRTCIALIKNSRELALLLRITLQVVNFLKGTRFAAINVEDLKKEMSGLVRLLLSHLMMISNHPTTSARVIIPPTNYDLPPKMASLALAGPRITPIWLVKNFLLTYIYCLQ